MCVLTSQECVRRRLLTGERLLTRGGAELISLATVLEYVCCFPVELLCLALPLCDYECLLFPIDVSRYPSAVTAVTTRPGLDPTIVALASEVNKLF